MSRDVYGDYNNQRIFATLGTGTYTLQTANKVMISDVVIHSTDTKLIVTYNNSNIIDTENDGVYTLKTKGKKCSTDIVVDVQEKTPAGFTFSLTLDWDRYSPLFTIYDGQDNTGNMLGTISGSTQTLNGTCTTGYLYILVGSTSSYAPIIMSWEWNGTPVNISEVDTVSWYMKLQVTGNNASASINFEMD